MLNAPKSTFNNDKYLRDQLQQQNNPIANNLNLNWKRNSSDSHNKAVCRKFIDWFVTELQLTNALVAQLFFIPSLFIFKQLIKLKLPETLIVRLLVYTIYKLF